MGNVWQKILSKYHNKEVRILMVGLDAAGKTTILYRMKLGEVVTTIPTVGFNVETIDFKGSKFVAWDVGGRDKIKPLWRHYYQNTDVLLFVVDSSDHDRIGECKEELWRFIKEDELKDAVVLIMANKQDLPNAMSVDEVAEKMEVDKLEDKKIYVQGACACKGEGLFEGLSWIQKALTQQALKNSMTKPVKEVLTAPEKKSTSYSWWSTISSYFIQTPTVK